MTEFAGRLQMENKLDPTPLAHLSASARDNPLRALEVRAGVPRAGNSAWVLGCFTAQGAGFGVANVVPADTAGWRLFRAAAHVLAADFHVAYSTDPELQRASGCDPDAVTEEGTLAVVLGKDFGSVHEPPAHLLPLADALGWGRGAAVGTVCDFVEARSVPLAGVLTELNGRLYHARPLAVVFTPVDYADAVGMKVFQRTRQAVLATAAGLRGRLGFALADVEVMRPLAEGLGLRDLGDATTAVAIMAGGAVKYLMPPIEDELSTEALTAWAADVLAERVPPHYKSERAPKKRAGKGKLQKVVGSTFARLVLDPAVDALVFLHDAACAGPCSGGGCSLCQAALENYTALAARVGLKRGAGLLLAKMDLRQNDAPPGFSAENGLPAIWLSRAAAPLTQPLEFDRPNTAPEDFAVFLARHAAAELPAELRELAAGAGGEATAEKPAEVLPKEAEPKVLGKFDGSSVEEVVKLLRAAGHDGAADHLEQVRRAAPRSRNARVGLRRAPRLRAGAP
jgi:hypothetical protein